MTVRRTVGLGAVAALVAAIGWFALERSRSSRETDVRPVDADSIVMLGDSITWQGDWPALLPGAQVVNRGVPGFTTRQLVAVAEEVSVGRPRVVFLMTGTNDVRDGLPPGTTVAGVAEILGIFRERSPDTRVVIQTVLPRAEKANEIALTNAAIVELASANDVTVLDLHALYDDGAGGLRPADTTDGWHLTPRGYDAWGLAVRAELETDQTR